MLTPKQTVAALDKYIIGQDKAKRAVAIALRNRYRRAKLDPELREEICPKNIIMIGSTGVGKTEIARRLAKLVDAPFVKVEATKFTEVGYVGRDVDSIIRDLVDVSVHLTKSLRVKSVTRAAEAAAEERVLDALMTANGTKVKSTVNTNATAAEPAMSDVLSPLQSLFTSLGATQISSEAKAKAADTDTLAEREKYRAELRAGNLENVMIDIKLQQPRPAPTDAAFAIGIDFNSEEIINNLFPKTKKNKRVKVSDARRLLIQEEADRLIDMDEVTREAIENTEQNGIVFIDEIDKIALEQHGGHDVSREGVQRDILPIVEGCTVSTKYGIVKTDHILFIAAGAFHMTKVSDLIPELQGRFPIRVELENLTVSDYKRILTQPQNAVIKQYKALLATDNVEIHFTSGAIDLIAQYAHSFNESNENIGARRLHTIMENLLEEVSFNAGSNGVESASITIDKAYVSERISEDSTVDLRRYIL